MSILILALPRTGSSILMEALGKALGMYIVNEPFNPVAKKDFSVSFDSITPESNILVKSTIDATPGDSDPIEWYGNFSKKFKHHIFLDRYDTYDQCISFTNAKKTNRWHDNYKAEINEEDINKCQIWISKYKSMLEILSNQLNIPITYYENYFNQDVDIRRNEINRVTKHFNRVNGDIYIGYTNPSRRYRKQRNTSKLL